MLVIACLVVVAALLLRTYADGRVGPAWMPQLLLPPLCLSREWFGISCPGCGLTRSFVHLAHGDLAAAWQAHRLGWLLAGCLVLQIPYRLHALRRPQRPLLSTRFCNGFGQSLIALLFLNWLLAMFFQC